MAERHCTHCGSIALARGIVKAQTYRLHWRQRSGEEGALSALRQLGQPKESLEAHRCRSCGHLEWFVS